MEQDKITTAGRSQYTATTIEGIVTTTPEVREIAKGRKVARMTVRVEDRYRDADGHLVTSTAHHTVVAWGTAADQVERYLRKGSQIQADGRSVTRSYTDRKGERRTVAEVVVNSFQLLTRS